jgi:pimeloyl-ACP methyl ester carboxylesterase
MNCQKTSTKLVMTSVILGLLIGAGGSAYNALCIRYYRHIAGIPGKLYVISGHAMHLYCTGRGSPTIVLSSGLGDDSLGWAKIQPVLSQETRVCSYDRAGFGWSDEGEGVQDANAISTQLHKLIEAALIQRPIILVGHSISGIYLRSYAAHYPSDLAGLVLVDGATPLQDERIPKELIRIQEAQRRQMPWQKLLMTFGWYRLRGVCTGISPGFEAYSAWIKADSCIPSQIHATEIELDAERISGEETVHAGPFNDLPVLILSRDPNIVPSNWPAAVSRDNAVVWSQMQEEAKDLSRRSKRIIARGSDHYIQVDRPDVVNREVAELVMLIRNHQTFPSNRPTGIE